MFELLDKAKLISLLSVFGTIKYNSFVGLEFYCYRENPEAADMFFPDALEGFFIGRI